MASADAINIDDIFYNLDFSTKTAVVTSNPNKYSGSIDIPSSVTFKGSEYSVICIGDNAFSGCDDLTSVSIPNSVTSIGNLAFADCNTLTAVHIKDIAAWCNISFRDYSSNPLCYAHHLFMDEKEIKDLVIPNSVTSIGKFAFRECSGLTSIEIPNSVTSIGGCAFENCYGLTSITIPNSVTSIGNDAFQNCSSLASVTIPNSVTSIGKHAFYSCSNLTSVHITDIAAWCKINFADYCSNPLYDGKNLFLDDIEITNLVIPNSVTAIGNYTFSGCSGLISIEIPNSVTSIGSYAFAYCSDLTSVTIPNSVISMGEAAFIYCSSLTSITIPNSVTTIGGGAFLGCSGLTSIEIPNSVTTIEKETFFNCYNLTSVTIPNSVTSIEEFAFKECYGLKSINIPNSVTAIKEGTFEGCSGLISIEVPNSVTKIGNYAFQQCSSLTSVTIPNSVTTIGNVAFMNCSKLTSVHITDLEAWCRINFADYYSNPLYYAHHLFMDGKEITNLVIPNSVGSIGDLAFFYCSRLNTITIPNNMTSIGEKAFFGCSGLTDVYCYAENIPTTGGNAFYNGRMGLKNVTLHVLKQSIYDYKTTSPWSGFGTIKEITPLIDGVYYSIDSNNKQATVISGDTKYKDDVVIPSSVTFNNTEYSVICIGDSTFYSCDGLTSVSIPNTITSIGNAAFANCMELAEVYCYAKKVPTTGSDVFKESYINYVTLYVPASAVNAYKTTVPWSGFGSIVALPEPTLRGDVNGDGVVNGTDIQAVINVIVDGEYDEKADVNEDGQVNGTDIQEVINIIVNAD